MRNFKMSETKRYYWLKLPENFFDATDDETISFIEEQEGGSAYVLFYLKLLCKALRTDGTLIRLIGNRYVPYDEKSLSKLTNTPVDTVRCAVAILKEVGLLKQLDSGELYLTQINEFVGSETNKAVAMRKTRAKNRLEGNNVTPALPDCYPDVTQSKRKSKEKELENREEELEKELEEDISASDDARSVSTDVNPCKTNVRSNVNTNGKWTINDTLSVVEESNLSEPLKEKVCDWIQYKREEKRFTYKERSSKALVHEVEKAEQTYGSIAVIEQIGKAMSSGWQGMNLNLIETNGSNNKKNNSGPSLDVSFEKFEHFRSFGS
jgi:predicted phage replisome organizer